MHQKPSRIANLTKTQAKELCRMAGIPLRWHTRFVEAVERCVASYLRVRNQKSPLEVEGELKQIEKQVRGCLKLRDHKKWRPGKFRESLQSISKALVGLSQPAREYLQFRNLRVVHVVPDPWPPVISADVIIDPICFHCLNDQVDALFELRGALSGPVAQKREQSRPRKDAERALYHCLAVAYRRDTGKAASDSSTKFIDACHEIKQIYQLKDWNPKSLPRSARRLRKQEK